MDKRVKVLWISCVGEKGGAEVYMLNLLRRLDPAAFVPAVALLRPGPLEKDLKDLGIKTYVLQQHRMRDVLAVGRSIRQLARIAKEDQFDIIHGNGFRSLVYASPAAKLSGKRCLWLVYTVEQRTLSTFAIHRLPSDHVIAICQRTADYFVAQGHPTSLIWPSVDPEQLEKRTDRKTICGKYGLPANARWISMGARLQRYKGQEYFLRALASLPPSAKDVFGIVMGGSLFGMEQTFLSELKDLAQTLGISDRVRFTGFISDEDVRGFVAASEFLIHPALDEDFGLIVAEAQALGRPALAYASVGPAAIIADHETGRLVPIGDQAQLNQAMAEMLEDPRRLAEWGEAGKRRSIRLFEAAEATRQLERVYRSCLNRWPG